MSPSVGRGSGRYILTYWSICRWSVRIAIEWAVGFVHQFEDGLSVVLGDLSCRSVFLYLEVIFSLDEVGDALVLVGNGVGNVDFVLHPIGVFLEAHAFHDVADSRDSYR